MLVYLKNFIKDRSVASVTPTSPFGVRRLCSKIDFDRPLVIVEYGPGTGVFSHTLLDRMTKNSRLILIEINEEFVRELKKIDDPRLHVIHADVLDIRHTLDEIGIREVDYIISGIPFSFIDLRAKSRILEASREVLKPGGEFLAYQASRHLDPFLRRHFYHVETEFELLNIPPLCIYEARKSD